METFNEGFERRKPEGRVSRDFLLEHGANEIGYCVINCDDSSMPAFARTASTICRRRFRPQDVVLISVLDEEEEGNAGIAFTTDAIYYWEEDDNFVFSVRYSDIRNVDYDSNGVRIILGSDSESAHDDAERDKSVLFGKVLRQFEGQTERDLSFARKCNKLLPCASEEWNLDEEEEQGYIRTMYNFIADIVDEVNAVSL